MSKRIRLKYRDLPDYTKEEEIFNMTSCIVGASFSFIGLILCIVFSVLRGNLPAGITSSIYMISLVTSFTISSIYHGLNPGMGKKVLQVLNHCFVYFVIAGTYTPILLCAVRKISPVVGWSLFLLVLAGCALATVFTAIDLEQYDRFSMISYIVLGWFMVIAIKPIYEAMALKSLILLLIGGIIYTISAAVYIKGRTKRYVHSVFHLFVIVAAAIHFIAIFISIVNV